MLSTSSLIALPAPGMPPVPTRSAAAGPCAAPPVRALARLVDLREESQARRPRPDTEQSRRQPADTGARPAPWQEGGEREPVAVDAPGATPQFLTQIIGQDTGEGHGPLARHRDGPVLGSLAYRLAGGEPVVYSQEPTVFRIVA